MTNGTTLISIENNCRQVKGLSVVGLPHKLRTGCRGSGWGQLFLCSVLVEQFGDLGDFHGKAREGSGGGKMLLNTISVVGSVTIE